MVSLKQLNMANMQVHKITTTNVLYITLLV